MNNLEIIFFYSLLSNIFLNNFMSYLWASQNLQIRNLALSYEVEWFVEKAENKELILSIWNA